MRPITPGVLAGWIIVLVLGFGPPLQLPAIGSFAWPTIFGPSAGPRLGVIVRESFDDTPAMSRMFDDFREGPAAKYLADHHDSITLLDDDETDASNQPLPFLVKYGLAGKFANGAHTPAELLIFTGDSSRLLGRQALPPDATADTVLAAFKKYGG